MSCYSIHAFDDGDEIALSHIIRCSDDLDALSAGIGYSNAQAIEIWRGERLLARVTLGNAPLRTEDARNL